MEEKKRKEEKKKEKERKRKRKGLGKRKDKTTNRHEWSYSLFVKNAFTCVVLIDVALFAKQSGSSLEEQSWKSCP